ncbi:MAG: hypothetical protein JXQ90_22325 [Cyclobacteriaceae bacterium]
MKKLLVLVLLCAHSICYGQRFSEESVKDDLIFLKSSIRSFNPGLDKFNPEFDKQADELIKNSDNESTTLLNLYQKVSELSALSNEGHFDVTSKLIFGGFGQNEYLYLPITVIVLEGSLYVWFDLSNEQLMDRGNEILNINGKSAQEILQTIYKYFPSDGLITTYIDRTMASKFPLQFYLYVDQSTEFELSIIDNSGNEKLVQVAALDRSVQIGNYQKFYPNEEAANEPPFSTLTFEDNIAFLTLPSFDSRKVNDFEIKSKKLYEEIIIEVIEKKTQHLVIDLRNNSGERNEFAYDIVPFINRNEILTGNLLTSTAWDGKTRQVKIPKSAKQVYHNAIYLLVNGRTYGAAGVMARYLKEFGDAIVIGEETGSRYEGFVGEPTKYINLPYSKITIGIPGYLQTFPQSEKQPTTNRGLIPDHEIHLTINDVINDQDPQMEFVKTLIKR